MAAHMRTLDPAVPGAGQISLTEATEENLENVRVSCLPGGGQVSAEDIRKDKPWAPASSPRSCVTGWSSHEHPPAHVLERKNPGSPSTSPGAEPAVWPLPLGCLEGPGLQEPSLNGTSDHPLLPLGRPEGPGLQEPLLNGTSDHPLLPLGRLDGPGLQEPLLNGTSDHPLLPLGRPEGPGLQEPLLNGTSDHPLLPLGHLEGPGLQEPLLNGTSDHPLLPPGRPEGPGLQEPLLNGTSDHPLLPLGHLEGPGLQEPLLNGTSDHPLLPQLLECLSHPNRRVQAAKAYRTCLRYLGLHWMAHFRPLLHGLLTVLGLLSALNQLGGPLWTSIIFSWLSEA
ncbi:splicing factor 3A subunit 2-like [Phoca vitulina]|uniref:splicing factor 3A subunit 2-like n=1 Tax=Phoca vitulina TaxID=9720 RepID=UPI0013960218|nr:splicing factor 3A subunit 2-like [Phoca vitulina]